jgi:hypothetical protein
MAFDLENYATEYESRRTTYLEAANALKLATGPYKAARDAYVAATATYTKSLYERRRLGEAPNLEQLKVFQDAYWKAGSSSSALDTAEAIDKLMSSVRTPGRKLDHDMLEAFATTYRETRDAYLEAANALKMATGPYKAARDAYVAASATYTKSLYERRRLGDNLLSKKVSESHAYKQLVAQSSGLTMDDLEKLSSSPEILFTSQFNHNGDTSLMGYGDLEKMAENPSVIENRNILLASPPPRPHGVSRNPHHGFEMKFDTNDDNSVGAGANTRWSDIMYNNGDARSIPNTVYNDEITNVALKGWAPTLSTPKIANKHYDDVYETALSHDKTSPVLNPSPNWSPSFN